MPTLSPLRGLALSLMLSLVPRVAAAEIEGSKAAKAAQKPLTVDWTGPAECGPATTLEKESSRLLGKLAATADVRVIGTASRLNPELYRVELVLSGNVSGARSFESSNCQEAIQAAAVVLALAINPDALLTSTPEVESSKGPPAKKPQQAPPPEPADETGNDPELRMILGLAGRLSSGLTPFPAWGASLHAGLEWRRLRLEIYVASQPSSTLELEPEGSVSFRSRAAGLRICGQIFRSLRFSARTCAGGAWNKISAAPTELEEKEAQSATVFSAELGATLALRLHPQVSAFLSGAVQLPTTRPRFTVSDADGTTQVVHEVSPGGVGTLGVEFNF